MKPSLFAVVAAVCGLLADGAAAQTSPQPPTSVPSTASNTHSLRLSATPVLGADFLMQLHEKSTITHDFRDSGNPLEMSEATRLAAAAGVDCDVVDAGAVSRKAVLAYEVACKKDLGWVVLRREDGSHAAYDCLALAASAKAITRGREIATCRLRSNVGRQTAGLQLLATKARLDCTVVDGEFKGFGGSPQISRYEVKCKGAGGYLIDAPSVGSSAELAIAPCDKAFTIGAACTLKR